MDRGWPAGWFPARRRAGHGPALPLLRWAERRNQTEELRARELDLVFLVDLIEPFLVVLLLNCGEDRFAHLGKRAVCHGFREEDVKAVGLPHQIADLALLEREHGRTHRIRDIIARAEGEKVAILGA